MRIMSRLVLSQRFSTRWVSCWPGPDGESGAGPLAGGPGLTGLPVHSPPRCGFTRKLAAASADINPASSRAQFSVHRATHFEAVQNQRSALALEQTPIAIDALL